MGEADEDKAQLFSTERAGLVRRNVWYNDYAWYSRSTVILDGGLVITSLWIDNFKSLNGFELRLDRFVCLVGLNGSGKSTVLQAIDLLSQLMRGDLELWLAERQWDRSDINSKLSKRSNIDFRHAVTLNGLGELVWEGSLNRKTLHCTSELVSMGRARSAYSRRSVLHSPGTRPFFGDL